MISGKRLIVAAFALSTVVMLVAAACSSAGRTTDPTPVQTFMVTPSALGPATEPPSPPTAPPGATATGAPTVAATAAPTAAETSAATPAATSTGGDGGTKIVIVALNLQFDKTSLTAPAGKITIELDNQDVGQPHNIHFFKGTDITGQDEGMTELHVGPTKDTLDLTLDKGTYFYQCDVHPTTMFGTLTVN